MTGWSQRTAAGGAVAGWVTLLAAGLWDLGAYGTIPGAAAPAPASWPADAPLERAAGDPVLLLFAHPRCPCTAATLENLARVLAIAAVRPRVHVLFVLPAGYDAAWAKAERWREAVALPGVTVHLDPEARLARRFGAATSGHALLYLADGRLAFAGGLTLSRGHGGDNPGATAIAAWLGAGGDRLASAPVFGCPLGAEARP